MFDYRDIPLGFYDRIFRGPPGIRKLWHVSKFERVLDWLPAGRALLDVGCFAGTFLSTVPEAHFSRQLGIDILAEQIAYADQHYATPFRSFRVATVAELPAQSFDAATLIEVIEHLHPAHIASMLAGLARALRPNAPLIVTTPNYASAWPVLEHCVDRLSEVRYEEQHVTRFSYFALERQLEQVYPELWRSFRLEEVTTSHFVTPFFAALSYDGARWLSRVVPHRAWKNPLGHLIMARLRRR